MNDINMLIEIPGQYISAGSRNLPSAETSTDGPQQAVVDVPGIGRVRFSYKRFKHKKARQRGFSGRRKLRS